MPYFDHNATTPLLPVAREAWLRANEEAWANPSSPYRVSARVHRLLEEARARVATLLGVGADEIIFTSGATEANNAVAAWAARTKFVKGTIWVSPTEHPSVLQSMDARCGTRVKRLAVNPAGTVEPGGIERVLQAGGGGLVAVMAANNETGVLQPVAAIDARCGERATWYLCDASQWIGRLPARGLAPRAFIVGCAHKFGGPKGAGFLRVPPAVVDFQAQRGGEQEHGRRAGTENYPAIAAMVAALEFAESHTTTERASWSAAFAAEILQRIPGARITSGEEPRLWNTVSLCLPAHENTRWVARLDKLGFEVSTGSACASGSVAPSHVLAAMGFSADEARRTIRVSSGWATTEQDWRWLADAIGNVWQQLQAEPGAG